VIAAAATVLLLRETEGTSLEVLMLRRAAQLSFMGGMWVFPGGRVDDADASPRTHARVVPSSLQACGARLASLAGTSLDAIESVALHVAACRETFEETGVLLAVDPSRRPVAAERVLALQDRRAAVADDAREFTALLIAEDLYLDLEPLLYWSHWITPSVEPKRFDTRFFVAPLPDGQSASADFSELTEHAWVQPSGVPALLEEGRLRVMPPTLLTLEDLAESRRRHGSLMALLLAEQGRATPPILPRIDLREDAVQVVMPWDPDYASIHGEGCAAPAGGYPPHLSVRRSKLGVARNRGAPGVTRT
jgi:8-oxo-dGTP pyrophosphatase MutT (NUDIX family)